MGRQAQEAQAPEAQACWPEGSEMARIIKSSEIDAQPQIEMTRLTLPEIQEAGSYAPLDTLGDMQLSSWPALSHAEGPGVNPDAIGIEQSADEEAKWLD